MMFPMPDRPRLFTIAVVLFVIAAVLVLAGCAASLGSGIGGATSITDEKATTAPTVVAQAQPPGIGGTGAPGTKSPGIGGTGDFAGAPGIGGTGIIGTVTAFGSIFVNGYEVDYAPDMSIRFKDATVRPNALRVGQVVEVEATGSGKRLQARSITVRHEVAGPIERIDVGRRVAVVFGQRIEIPSGVLQTSGTARAISINDLSVGDHIDVSGLRRANGVIAASHIAKTRPGAAAVIRGRVTSSDPSGFSVNGMRVEAPRANLPRVLVSGQDVQIIGTAVGGKLRARRINPAPARPFAGRVQNLSVEGYVTRAISGGAAIGQIPITRLPATARLRAGDRTILEGPVDRRGRFAPTRLQRPQINLNFPREGRRIYNRTQPAPRTQVLPPPSRAPVYRQPAPRAPVYRPQTRSRGR